jgi:hypothetical protein
MAWNLERRQPEGVAAVLDPEDAQEERVHAEKDGTPDEDCDLLLAGIRHPGDLESKADGGEGEDTVCESWSVGRVEIFNLARLTHSGNDLRLETELVLETAGEVGETALAVVASVGHLADVVEHVSAGEKQDKNQADGGPQVAVLDDGKDVGRGDGEKGEDTNDSGCDCNDLDIVDRTLDRWVRRVGKVTAQPRVDRISLVGTDAIGMLAVKYDIDI